MPTSRTTTTKKKLTIVSPSTSKGRAVARSNTARAIVRQREGGQPGNGNAMTHGIYGTVAIREEVADEVAYLFARAPWLDPVRDGILVEATARILVRLRSVDDFLTDNPDKLGSAVYTTFLTRMHQTLRLNLASLGLSPKDAADLGVVKLDAAERARRLGRNALDQYRLTPGDDDR